MSVQKYCMFCPSDTDITWNKNKQCGMVLITDIVKIVMIMMMDLPFQISVKTKQFLIKSELLMFSNTDYPSSKISDVNNYVMLMRHSDIMFSTIRVTGTI